MRGIGSRHTGVGTELVEISFTLLGIVPDVTFHIMDVNVPSLPSLKDMLDTDLDISITERKLNRE